MESYRLGLHVQGQKSRQLVRKMAQFMAGAAILSMKGSALWSIRPELYYTRDAAPVWSASYCDDNSGTFELRYKTGVPCVRARITKDGYAVGTFFDADGTARELSMVQLFDECIDCSAWKALDTAVCREMTVASFLSF